MPKKLKQYLIRRFGTRFINLKWQLLGFYYEGLVIQAHYLYRQSILYKLRWQELGLDYAEETFKGWELTHFFSLAKKEPVLIKAKIFWDGLLGHEHVPYCISKPYE